MGDFDNWKDKYLGYVDKVISYIPYRRVAEWKAFGLDPLPKVSKPEGILQRIKDLYAMLAIRLVFTFVSMLPVLVIGGALVLLYSIILFGIPLIFVAAALGIMVLSWILSPVFTLLYCLVEYAIAKLLGGKGDYNTHFNAAVASSLAAFSFELPLLAVYIPVAWLTFVPCLGYLMMFISFPISLLMMAIGLYGIYLRFICIRQLHDLTSGKSAAVVILPIVLIFILMLVLILLFYASIFAFMLSLPMAAAGAAVGAGAGGASP